VTGEPSADLVVDSRGRRCPLPIIDLARRIGEVPVGGVVSLVADDPAARHDVPAWCEMRGQEYLGEATEEGAPAYRVRRTS
jgi:cysteine desulfurase